MIGVAREIHPSERGAYVLPEKKTRTGGRCRPNSEIRVSDDVLLKEAYRTISPTNCEWLPAPDIIPV